MILGISTGMRTNSFNWLLLKCNMYLARTGKIRSFNKMQPATFLQHSPFPISQLGGWPDLQRCWLLQLALTSTSEKQISWDVWMTIVSENQAIRVATSCSFHLGSGCIMLWFSHVRDHNSFTSFIQTWYLLLRGTLDKCWMLLISHYFCNEHASDRCWLQKAQSEFGFTGCSEGRGSHPAAR